MKNLIAAFSQHLREALEIGEKAELRPSSNSVNNVIVTGLGGSGIGGKIVAQLVEGESTVPIAVNNDYFLPAYVNENSLVIVSSYSGNTEETLSAMHVALEKKAQVCCITSGGKVVELARDRKLNHIIIPGGMPPRAAFGYSFTQLFFVLNHYGIIGGGYKEEIEKGIHLLEKEEKAIQQEAKEIADKLHNKLPIIYSAGPYEGVGIRFRQQINENAKMLAWHHVFPELNHNELVGWRTENQDLAVIIIRNTTDYDRIQRRIEVSKEIFNRYTNTIIELKSKGNSDMERSLYLIHLGDWTSCYLAEKKGIDPVEVNVIDYLKGELAKL